MKILVTGGCGFIGSHIVDAYVDAGHRVFVIDNLSTGQLENLNPGAKLIKDDICNEDIEELFKKEKFDVINHHAAQINVRKSVEDPLFDARVNIIGSINLLRLAAKYHIKRFIFASSGGVVYGEPVSYPISEDFPYNPLSPYGISKMAVEQYILNFAPLYNFDYVIFRYSNVYGPRQIAKSEAGVISIFINQILNGEKCDIFGDGKQMRDYVYVDDVIQANILALKCQSDILNIGTGIATSVNELIEILSEVTADDVVYEHTDPRPGEVFKNVLDNSKAQKRIGWRPQTKLKQGILKTFEYFRRVHSIGKKIS